jgi:membrane dipeptidase
MTCRLTRNSFYVSTFCFFVFFILGCIDKKQTSTPSDEELKKQAIALAHRYLIMDGHVDYPSILWEKKIVPSRDKDTLINTGKGDFDYKRAMEGGLTAPFMSIYVPAAFQKRSDYGKSFADSLIQLVKDITLALPDKFALANTPNDVEANFKAGKISLPMGMENGAPIGMDIRNVKHFFDQGIRYITLAHNKDNQICDSSGDSARTSNGLSSFGKEVVKEMNRLGIMVDISHVGDSTFYQVIRLTTVPVIASHSSCRYFSPMSRRDMTDDMIRKLGEHNGVMLINFYEGFLDSAFSRRMGEADRAENQRLKAAKVSRKSKEGQALVNTYRKENPIPRVDISKVIDHIDHAVQLAGIDHVGMGSDFDGVDEMLPAGLEDVSRYPDLIFLLLKRGYSETDIEKLLSGNFKRVWQQATDAAGKK